MSRLRIRRARESDLDVLVGFNALMADETEGLRLRPSALRRGVAAVLRDPAKGFYLVAEREGRVVGQLMVTTEWSDWRNCHWWWFQSVFVVPGERRRGVFRALYREVRTRARRAGARGLRLYVETHNRVAQRAYQSLGMRGGRYQLFELGGE